MKENWRLICEVYFNYSTNETPELKVNYSILLSRISQLTNDANSSTVIHQSRETLLQSNDPYDFTDDDDLDIEDSERTQLHSRQHRKPQGEIREPENLMLVHRQIKIRYGMIYCLYRHR